VELPGGYLYYLGGIGVLYFLFLDNQVEVSLRSTRLTPNLADNYEYLELSAQARSDAMREYGRLRKMFMIDVEAIWRRWIRT